MLYVYGYFFEAFCSILWRIQAQDQLGSCPEYCISALRKIDHDSSRLVPICSDSTHNALPAIDEGKWQ